MLTASRRPTRRPILDACLSRWGILDWLRLSWCAAVLWYEVLSFLWSLSSCSWPDGALSRAHERPAHVLVLADSQLRDLSFSQTATLRQYLLDLTLKRNWFFASWHRPDLVVFLGDILASWRLIRSDEEYERHYNKFLNIFHMDRRLPAYFVPGNNDIGLNIEQSAARQARQRFTTHFGPLNQKITVRNHTLVMLDAASLVEEDYLRAGKYIDYDHWTPLPRGPVEFIHTLQEGNGMNGVVLFTHIPLHRPDTASCGPLRESGTIQRGAGSGYQNTLGKKTTTFLLHRVTPQLVFSADDKDYCDYVHVPPRSVVTGTSTATEASKTEVSQPQNVREVTVKAFSPSSKIRYPGFQLLSLTNPAPSSHLPSLATVPCFLPDYRSVYTWRYLPLLILTSFAIVFLRRRKLRSPRLPTHLKQTSLRESFSSNSLPHAPWSPHPHASTPFSAIWSPHTPGANIARPHSPHSPADIPSPQEELQRDTLRTPLMTPHAHTTSTFPTTPTFRATTLPRAEHEPSLPTGPAQLEVDELDEDEDFAYARYDQRAPLRVKLTRHTHGADSDLEDFSDSMGGGGMDELAFTFTLYGRRRRVSLWIPLLTGWGRTGPATRLGGYGGARRWTKRAFVRRVGMDLLYVLWPAMGLWLAMAWWMS